MATERYPGQRSEYGGGDGTPQRDGSGASLPLTDLASGDVVSERARLMRTAGLADFDATASTTVGRAGLDPSKMSAAEREAYENDVRESARREAERKGLVDKTNGYILEPDTYIGESGEGNGVQGFGS